MWTLVGIAIITFVITNLDDLVVLTSFAGHEQFDRWDVLLGQYTGFSILLLASLLGGLTATTLVDDYVQWLGILPIFVGLIWMIRMNRNARAWNDPDANGSRIGAVAGVGVANGADNIAVYVPLFAVLGGTETGIVVLVFLVAAGGLILVADWLSDRPVLADRLETHGDRLVPAVLIALGGAILVGLV